MQNADFNLQDMGAALHRQRRIITSFGLIAFVTSALLCIIVPRSYDAQALIMLQAPENILAGDSNTHTPLQESIILSEVEILHSRDIIEGVIGNLHLNTSDNEKLIQHLINYLTVKPVMRSLVIRVDYNDPDPVLAAKIANEIVHVYQAQQSKQKERDNQKTEILLQEQLTTQQINDMSTQLVSAQADLAAVQAKQQQIQDIIDHKLPLENMSDFKESSLMLALKQDEATLTIQRAQLASKYGPHHPRLIAVNAQIAENKAKQAKELVHLAENLKNDVATDQTRVDGLKANLDQLQKQRSMEKLTSTPTQQTDSKIISLARVPVHPDGPSRLIIIFLATLAGTLLGLILALMVDQLKSS
jgi:uncharacterized protein involved in exopolysaccharide biosynthesis